MRLLRKALLIITAAILISPIFVSLSYAKPRIPIPDVRLDELFYPHIRRLFENHFIQGDDGTGLFRPDESINRAEFTKITAYTRLAEKYGLSESWDDKGRMGMSETVSSKLQYYYQCDHSEIPQCSSVSGADIQNVCNVCESIGNKPFSDVAEKKFYCEEKTGFKEPCDPWFGQYVYYAVRKGFIKGYLESGKRLFRPGEDILRLHALKMIMVDDGNIPPESDTRYGRLKQKAEDNSSYRPKCLAGAENYILYNNGGSTADSRKLLDYALLADRLDLFGNDCSVFGEAKTPMQRAAFLQQPMARKEAPRYFALTMEYDPVEANPETDPTINMPPENEIGEAGDSAYEIPDYVEAEILAELGLPSDTEDPEDEEDEDIPDEEPEDTVPDEDEEEEESIEGPVYGPIEDPSRNNCEYINYEYEITSKWPNGVVSPGNEIALRIAPTANSTWHVNPPCSDLKLVRLDRNGNLTDTEAKFSQEIKDGVATWKASFASINQLDKTQDSEQQTFVIIPDYEKVHWVSDKIYWTIGNGEDYWYTVIKDWHTVNDGLWGGVFKEKRYNKENFIETLFPVKSGDKYKELVVQAIGEASDYDNTDTNATANKKAMIKNYRTTRWYKISYINPKKLDEGEKVGWVPVSGTVKKDEEVFDVVDGSGNYGFRNNIVYIKYSNGILVCSGGSGRSEKPVDKIILHNTAGSNVPDAGNGCAVHYYLARNHNSYGDKFVIRVPEYLTTETASNAEAEQKAIVVEMVNWEWANPVDLHQNRFKRMVNDGKFNEFDFEKLKGDYSSDDDGNKNHYVEISGERYEIVKYFFSETNGFFEVFNHDGITREGERLKKKIGVYNKDFDECYEKKLNEDVFILKPEYKNLITKQNITDEERKRFNKLYEALNRIPFNHKFFSYSAGVHIFDITNVVNPQYTYPLETYRLPGTTREQAFDGTHPDYYEKYTLKQYVNLNTFINHMNAKYGIPEKTFNYELSNGIPKEYGFYYQKPKSAESAKISNKASEFKGIVSHRNTKYGGKMCPAPGFQIDRIPVLQNQ